MHSSMNNYFMHFESTATAEEVFFKIRQAVVS